MLEKKVLNGLTTPIQKSGYLVKVWLHWWMSTCLMEVNPPMSHRVLAPKFLLPTFP
ncbi:hypothetical protein QFZ72_004472 [Bacillus sp. V2I10]|nr:hypothetical protein [Bacillus sp. V2I10]